MPPSLAALVPMASFAWPAVALVGVLALILLSQRLVRLSGVYRQTAGRRLAVVEAMALDPRRRLHLIKCDQHTVLLLTGGNEDVVVGWLREGQP